MVRLARFNGDVAPTLLVRDDGVGRSASFNEPRKVTGGGRAMMTLHANTFTWERSGAGTLERPIRGLTTLLGGSALVAFAGGTAFAADAAPAIDTGDTAWVLTASAL